MQENETCRYAMDGYANDTYAIDIAQIEQNIAIVNAMENARSAVSQSNIDPSCITILEWLICFFRFPPCLDTKLILPCGSTCGELILFFLVCFDTINKTITDPTVREHFNSYGCRLPESYYVGYDRRYFVISNTQCVGAPVTG